MNKSIIISTDIFCKHEWILNCKNDKFASKHIELKSNQYLEDVLPNLKLKHEM